MSVLEGADYMYIMSRGLCLDKGVEKFLKSCQFLYIDAPSSAFPDGPQWQLQCRFCSFIMV